LKPSPPADATSDGRPLDVRAAALIISGVSNPPTWHYPAPGQPPAGPAHGWPPAQPPRRKGLPWWAWALIAGGGLIFLTCVGGFAWLVHVGNVGPDTKVYAGNEVPARFMDTMKELKLIEPGEQIRYFYSDAVKDIKDGFYFVSDRKVVVYKESAATPATKVKFDQITDASLSGPVSSEQGRDKLFFKAIQEKMPKRRASSPE
jgi:hypothetical protein